MWFTERIVAHLTKETIKNKKLPPRECKVVLADKKSDETMYITINYDNKIYWNMFKYGKLWYDKYIMTTKLRQLHFLKKNIEYLDK